MWSFEADGIKHAFTGDSVAYNCHCFFRDGNALTWLKLMDRLETDLDMSKTQLYFGHGTTPGGLEVIQWQRGYIQKFIDTVRKITDRSLPVPRSVQEAVIAEMQTYLPGETTLFLLDYEMDVTLEHYYKQITA
jgi:glyoxylase-like metal-dependent hydrolase (beta-lactamase superfamily II)